MIKAGIAVRGARVGILGFTFKENCPDTRNTKVIDIVKELEEYGIQPEVFDEMADAEEAKRLYGIEFVPLQKLENLDIVIIAVAHENFLRLQKSDIRKFFDSKNSKKVLIDIKGILERKDYENDEFIYWRL